MLRKGLEVDEGKRRARRAAAEANVRQQEATTLNKMRRILQFIQLPMALIAIVLAISILVYPFFVELKDDKWSDRGSVAAVLLAVGAIFIAMRDKQRSDRYSTSLFYLEKSINGMERAYDKISDGNNSRQKWIAAARILAKSYKVGGKVIEQEHKEIFEIEMDHWRLKFFELLDQSPQFFFGAANQNVTLDQAAEESTARVGDCISTLKSIPEQAIHTIYKVIEFPKNYEDILTGTFDEHDPLLLSFEGIRKYLAHKREWISACGKLHRAVKDDN
jgi:hypothetical protein